MFSKLAVVFFVASAVVASPAGPKGSTTTTTTTITKCNSGSLQCCQDFKSANDASVLSQYGILPVEVRDLTGQIGINCNPVTAAGLLASGAKCNVNPVCCDKTSNSGLAQIGCSSGNLNA